MASITKPFQTTPPIKIGTLSKILHNIARHHNITVEVLLSELKLWRRIENLN